MDHPGAVFLKFRRKHRLHRYRIKWAGRPAKLGGTAIFSSLRGVFLL